MPGPVTRPLQHLQRRAIPVEFDRLQARMTTGQGSGLVEKDLADPGKRLQHRAIAHQYATPRRSRDARQHGNRYRQYQRARRGDHQHRQHALRVATGPPGKRGDQQRQRDEGQRVAVRQAHEGRPGLACRLGQVHDAGIGALRRGPRGHQQQRRASVAHPTGHRLAAVARDG